MKIRVLRVRIPKITYDNAAILSAIIFAVIIFVLSLLNNVSSNIQILDSETNREQSQQMYKSVKDELSERNTTLPTPTIATPNINNIKLTPTTVTIQCRLHTGRTIMSDRETCDDFNARKYDPYSVGGTSTSTSSDKSSQESSNKTSKNLVPQYPTCTYFIPSLNETVNYHHLSPEECQKQKDEIAKTPPCTVTSTYNNYTATYHFMTPDECKVAQQEKAEYDAEMRALDEQMNTSPTYNSGIDLQQEIQNCYNRFGGGSSASQACVELLTK